MESYARFLVRRAWLVLLAVALATVWIGAGIGKLRSEFNVESSLPANHPLVEIDRTIRQAVRRPQHRSSRCSSRARATSGSREVLQVVQDATLRRAAPRGHHRAERRQPRGARRALVQDVDGRIEADLLMRDLPQTPAGDRGAARQGRRRSAAARHGGHARISAAPRWCSTSGRAATATSWRSACCAWPTASATAASTSTSPASRSIAPDRRRAVARGGDAPAADLPGHRPHAAARRSATCRAWSSRCSPPRSARCGASG